MRSNDAGLRKAVVAEAAVDAVIDVNEVVIGVSLPVSKCGFVLSHRLLDGHRGLAAPS